MLTTETTAALRCPKCGKVEFHNISLFNFSGKRELRIQCVCGVEKFALGFKEGRFVINFSCALCDAPHVAYFSKKEFLSDWVKTLICPQTHQETGWIGPEDDVRQQAEAERNGSGEKTGAARILEQAGRDFFQDPDIMVRVLEAVHAAAEGGRLACSCGQRNLRMDIFRDRLELDCADCGRYWMIPAAREQDLCIIDRIQNGLTADSDWIMRP